MKKVAKKSKRIYIYLVIAFATICVTMGFVCFHYYLRLQTTVKEETSGYMQEIAKQMGANADKIISDNFAILVTVSTILDNAKINNFAQLSTMIEAHKANWNFHKILLIDTNGVAYDSKGLSVALAGDEYLQDVVVLKKPSMSVSKVIEGVESIVIAIPLTNVEIDARDICAIAGVYDLSSFDKMLAMSAFSGQGYAHIIRSDGTVVVRSSSENALQTGYNILHSLSESKVYDSKSIQNVYDDLNKSISGQLEFDYNGAHEYMTYTPLATLNWNLLTFVPVTVVNEKSNILLRLTLFVCGFITMAFAALFVFIMATFIRNKRKLEKIAYVDAVTSGNTMSRFTEISQLLLATKNANQYAMLYSNIEKFKVLNEQFGRAACDDILRSIVIGIEQDLDDEECIGRLFADNFCLMVKYTTEAEMLVRFDRWQKLYICEMERRGIAWLPPIVEFGVFVIINNSLPLSNMMDRAKLSLYEGASDLRGRVRYSVYDEHVRKLLFREKQLEDMMLAALGSKEFNVFLQPKYHTQSEEIGGAEALVRWNSQSEGMIYPDEFIPLFEKNGFITQLDLYVFEQVCITLRCWIDAGKKPVKISVNCSRMNLKSDIFIEKYSELTKIYNIPNGLIEIELTENTVFQNVDTLSEIIREIHRAGFGCSMDDFGSGYSSLNLIQDIPVDTLKLDKIFFKNSNRDIKRTESVVGSIISMAKALSITTVAEGVEEKLQVEMLKRLNCDYIQGYYFAKPMPIEQFEEIAFKSNL